MGARAFTSAECKLLVDDVRVDYHHLYHPEENLPPPFDFVEETVVADKLIKLVHAEHVVVVVNDGLWLHFSWSQPPLEMRNGRYTHTHTLLILFLNVYKQGLHCRFTHTHTHTHTYSKRHKISVRVCVCVCVCV